MDLFLWLSAGHFLGDFAFQSDWMADAKRTSWEANAYHAATYAAAILIAAAIGGFRMPVSAIALFFASHFCIDPLKARWGIINSIWLDQLLHFGVIALAVFFLQ